MVRTEIKFNHINAKKYNRLLSAFKNGTKEYSKISFDNKLKKRTMIGNTIWQNKTILNTIKGDLYDVLTVQESDTTEPANFNSNYTREKFQTHYHIAGYDLYLSKIMTKDKNIMTNQYEVQLDYDEANDKLNTIIEQLLLTMNDTNVVYTEAQRLLLVNDCNKALNINNNNMPSVFVKTKHLDIKEIDYNVPYIVSTKAKGKRRMLIIHTTGIWLVNPPFDYNLLISYDGNNLDVFGYFINSWNVSMFDGTLVKPLNSTEYEFNYLNWFLCHDCLVFNKKDIRGNDYVERIDKVKTLNSLITRYVKDDFLKVSMQTTRVYNNFKEFYLATRQILNLQEVLNYDHDGLMFTAVNHYQTLYKWIPPSEITFDLAIYESGVPNKITLHVYDENLQKDVPLDSIIEFDESMIVQDSFDSLEGTKKIGQCGWSSNLSQMYLIKVRNDKSQADSVYMVLDNWKNVNDPLTC